MPIGAYTRDRNAIVPLLSDHKIFELLAWKNSGFHVHTDTDLIRPSDIKRRQRLAEPERSGDGQPVAARRVSEMNQYRLRVPFSLQKITWNPETRTNCSALQIYRSMKAGFVQLYTKRGAPDGRP